jgi:peptide/nickel transport system substrate-binding protein
MVRTSRLWWTAAAFTALAPFANVSAQTTDVGTPRKETLVVDILTGRVGNPKQMNPYQEGNIVVQGLHQLGYSNLWEIDTVKGVQYPALAATMPEALDDTYTKWRFKVRTGLAWSDGQPFSAEDVRYTAQMILDNPKVPFNRFLAANIKSIKAVDAETVEVETTKALPKIGYSFGSVIFGNNFRVVPKHVWEKVDVSTFNNFPPVTIGPYKLKEVDNNGYWFLWEKRDDWQKTDVGQIVGEPSPKFVLFRSFGPEEKRIIAMAQNDIDVLTDISPESLDILRNQNDKVKSWFDNFPYANLDDPCERGISFNSSTPPYDKWQVRWALALATKIDDVSIGTFSGMLRASPLHVPPISILMKTYHEPMTPWLKEFALPNGYKPFDPGFSARMGKRLSAEGVEGLPSDEAGLRSLFGVGWWKYDPAEAAKLLESVGFKKQGNAWLLPDGSAWKMTINAPADFEIESQRLAFAVANEWKKFGVDVNVQQQQGGVFQTEYAAGNFQAGSYWNQTCAIGPDLWVRLEWWHDRYAAPTGQPTGFNRERYKNPNVSRIIDEMAKLTTTDPKNVELGTELLKELVTGMPVIPMFGTSKFVPVNTTYWTNFPSASNYYEGPWWWWSNFKYIMARVKPAQ